MIQINEQLWIQPENIASDEYLMSSKYLISIPLQDDFTLCINGLTGAIDLLPNNEYQRYLVSDSKRDATELLVKKLASRGHLSDLEKEKLLFNQLVSRLLESSRNEPLTIFLCPTNYCPMGCEYCIQGSSPRHAKRNSLSKEMVVAVFSAIERLRQLRSKKEVQILLFGGEPFQEYTRESIHEIFHNARRSGMKLYAFTNGLELKSYAPLIAEYIDVITGISVTLDGEEAQHNAKRRIPEAFSITVQGIEKLNSISVPVTIRTNIGSDNLDEIQKLRLFYEKHSWWGNPNFKFELTPITNHGCHVGLESPTHESLARHFIALVNEDSSYSRFHFMGLFSYLYYVAEQLKLIDFHPEEIGPHVKVPRVSGCLASSGSTFTFSSNGFIHMCNEQAGSEDGIAGRFWPEFHLDDRQVSKWIGRKINGLDNCRLCPYCFFCAGGCTLTSFKKNNSLGDCGTVAQDFKNFLQNMGPAIIKKWS